MLIQSYRRDELRFAYCYRVYLRWRTHYAKPCVPLARLDRAALAAIADEFGIRILECASNTTDLLTLVSLKPDETISGCTGKLKGRVSKWLREALRLQAPADLLSRGYFACTAGKSNRETVSQYLDRQGEHHGYAQRVVPPLFVEGYDLRAEDEARLNPKHAVVAAQLHLALATSGRRGVFGAQEGCAVAAAWRNALTQLQAALLKVSFLPDHVHLAVRLHPAVSPANLVVELMNVAQTVVFEQFPQAVIRAKVARLWQPSAYLGSFGDLASPQIRQYIHNWAEGSASDLTLHDTDAGQLEYEDDPQSQPPQ
jgi:REP element-mobilizing transposase RayT